MKKLVRAACLVAVAMMLAVPAGSLPVGAAVAQERESPTAGPEVKRMATMVGSWKDESQFHKTAFTEAGKEAGTSNCQWFTGETHVVCRAEWTGTAGPGAGLMVVGWHPGMKVYLAQMMQSNGMIQQLKGTVSGNTWTFAGEAPSAATGKPAKMRLTVVEVSPTLQTSKFEIAPDGGPWTVLVEGKSTKVK